MPYNLVKKVNSFINEIKSMGDNEVEANDDEEMDANDFELRLTEIWISTKEKVEMMKCNVNIN